MKNTKKDRNSPTIFLDTFKGKEVMVSVCYKASEDICLWKGKANCNTKKANLRLPLAHIN